MPRATSMALVSTPPRRGPMTSDPSARYAITKHSLLIAGHSTSISLEAVFWQRLRHVAAARGMAVAALVAAVDADRGDANLSSAIRVFLLEDALGGT